MSSNKFNALNVLRVTPQNKATKLKRVPLIKTTILSFEGVYLSEELGCKLSTDAVEQSIGQRKRSDFKILLS